MTVTKQNLHSNMDRFESEQKAQNSRSFLNLHSNMDRFESWRSTSEVRKLQTIYIPIWIDLKVWEQNESNKISAIYIPIWIDLKEEPSEIRRLLWYHLHSNMDRFERLMVLQLPLTAQDLHSNMDRFESATTWLPSRSDR